MTEVLDAKYFYRDGSDMVEPDSVDTDDHRYNHRGNGGYTGHSGTERTEGGGFVRPWRHSGQIPSIIIRAGLTGRRYSRDQIRFKPEIFEGMLEKCPSVRKFALANWLGQYSVRYGDKFAEAVYGNRDGTGLSLG